MFSYRKQRGHAGVLFAMMIPVLFGVFTVGSDGANALQSKARLNEALEVSALAVAAQDSDDDSTRRQTATAYITYYLPYATVDASNITVTKITCDEDNTTCDYDPTKSRFFQFTVTGTVDIDSWFPGNASTVGFGDTYAVASTSVARKYQSETIDIVYVADFSGSMVSTLNTATGSDIGKAKYVILKEIIEEVNQEVKEFNDKISSTSATNQSTVGFSAFNQFAHGSETSTSRQCTWMTRFGCLRYEDITTTTECNVDNWVYNSTSHNGAYINETETVKPSHIFADPVCYTTNNMYGTFQDIQLTEDFGSSSASFESAMQSYRPNLSGYGTTSSTQGIIQGAKLAYKGVNSRKLIIILSDGQDYPNYNPYYHATVTNKLVNAGLCDNIRDTLDAQVSSEGTSVKSRIALIGFDYNVNSTNSGLTNCVGGSSSTNIYQAYSSSELKTAILSLISEEIGHLADD